MTARYFESLFEFDALCSNISQIDENIELIAVLNNKGRAIEMTAKENGVNKDLTPMKREMLFMESVLKSNMNKEHNHEFGNVYSSILEREKFTVFSFEMLEYVILVISKTIINPMELKNRISEIIINSRKVELAQ
ncbi:MAG: hypothetical protein D4R96_02585 [Nitrosopumilaceae archaeon]|nr:MAG: hypothetical protein D4R96_02585 [Nitrosopumilaceae archaeon]